MLRSYRDYHHIRSGPPGQPSMNSSADVPVNVPTNIPVTMSPTFVPPPPMGGRGFPMLHGHVVYPLPPPTPVPSLCPVSFVSAAPAPPYVPPLPHSPPLDTPPPPPSVTSPPASPSLSSFAYELKTTSNFVFPAQPTKPSDPEIMKNIESMAEFVMKNGLRYESMARAKHAGDPKLAFLFENDFGPESVINREFYKWKKKVYQLYAQVEAEGKLNKHVDFDNDGRESQQTSYMATKVDEVPRSPEVSDMEMEDDLAYPLESTRAGSEPSTIGGDSTEQKQTVLPITSQSSFSSKEQFQPLKIVDNPAQGKRARCRLTNDYTGSLIDNYPSDTSEGSEDLETWEPGIGVGLLAQEQEKKSMMLSDQTASDHEPMAKSGTAVGTVISNLESMVSAEGQSAESVHLANASPPQNARNTSSTDDTDSALEKEERAEQAGKASAHARLPFHQHLSGYSKKRTSEPTSKESGSERGRKRGRSYSRSRSRGKSWSRSRSTSRSVSPSRSLSPIRVVQSNKPRSEHPAPRNELSNGDEEAFKEMRKRERKGAGSNVCLNYVGGRCFSSDACRLQHGDCAVDSELQMDQAMALVKLESTPEKMEDADECDGRGAQEVANTSQLVEGESGLDGAGGKVDGKSQGSADSTFEATLLPPSAVSTESVSITADLHTQGNSLARLPIQKDESDQLHAKAAHESEVTLPALPPFAESDLARQSRIDPSHIALSQKPSGPRPAVDSVGGFGFDQYNLLGSFGMFPSSQATASNVSHPAISDSIRSSHFPSDHTSLFQALSGSALQPVFPPPLTGLSLSSTLRQTDSPFAFMSSHHGFSDPSLSRQLHHLQYPPSYLDNSSHQFSLSGVPSNDAYSNVSVTLRSQPHSSTSWSLQAGSLSVSSTNLLDVPSLTGKSSSYSYALTMIPPLPSIIELPGVSNLSTSDDQYDPLADSFDTGPTGGSFSFLKAGRDGNLFGGVSSTLALHLENVSPGPDIDKRDLANINEAAGDPAVGIVENVSPPEEDTRNWSLGQPADVIEAEQGHGSSRAKKNHLRGLKLLRSAVADHVKEVLKPTWKEGRMSKDAFKSIVKKAVDKVTGALPSHHIPKSQEKVDQFMASSHTKISKLVQGYIDKYHKT